MKKDLVLQLVVVFFHIFTSSADVRALPMPEFREAPEFYNSRHCPPPNSAVHVAMTLDTDYLRGTMAAVLSVLRHASCPQNFVFHFVSAAPRSSPLVAAVSAAFPYLQFRVYQFDGAAVSGLISVSIRSALDCPLNYARSYLADLLPSAIRRVVYLDSDVILVDNVARLAATSLPEGRVSPHRSTATLTSPPTSRLRSGPTPPSPPRRSPAGRPATSTPASWSSTSTDGAPAATPGKLSIGWSCRSKPGFMNWDPCRRFCSSSPATLRRWITGGTNTASVVTISGDCAGIFTRGQSACCTGAGKGSRGPGWTPADPVRWMHSGKPTIS